MIKGIYAEDRHLLHPDQWVNVYMLGECDRASYYSSAQVKDLGELDDDEYGLEPVTEYGDVMSVKEARLCSQ
jgi:hypothetical protein